MRFVRSMSDFRSHAQTEADADRGRHGYIREDLHHFRPQLTSCLGEFNEIKLKGRVHIKAMIFSVVMQFSNIKLFVIMYQSALV